MPAFKAKKFNLNGILVDFEGSIYQGSCSTAAATQTKIVDIANLSELRAGISIRAVFTYGQEYDGTPKLKLNGFDAKDIYKTTSEPVGYGAWGAGQVLDFYYDGTHWIMVTASGNGTDGSSILREIAFSIATTDWTLSNGVYTADISSSYVTDTSKQMAVFDSSLRSYAKADISIAKKANAHAMTLTTAVLPTGTISGTLYLIDSISGQVAVVLDNEVVPIASGGTGANTVAGAQTELSIADRASIGIVEDGNTATRNISAGQYVIWKGSLYTASSPIGVGDGLSSTNLTAVPNGGLNALNSKFSTNVISSTNLDSLPDAFNMYSWWGGAGNTGLPSDVGIGNGCILVTYPANATFKQLQLLSTGDRYYLRHKNYLDVWGSWERLASNYQIAKNATTVTATSPHILLNNSLVDCNGMVMGYCVITAKSNIVTNAWTELGSIDKIPKTQYFSCVAINTSTGVLTGMINITTAGKINIYPTVAISANNIIAFDAMYEHS